MTVIERFLVNFRKWSSTAGERAGEITKAAAIKAEELSKVGKLKLDVYQLERQQNRLMADLGRITFKAINGTSKERVADLPGVDDLRRRLATIAEDIKRKTEDIDRASGMDEPVHKTAPIKIKAGAPIKKAAAKAGSKTTLSKKGSKPTASKKSGSAKGGTTQGKAGSRKKAMPKKSAQEGK